MELNSLEHFHNPPSTIYNSRMDIVLIGAGGHGRVVLDILRHSRSNNIVGFLDADPTLAGTSIDGIEVLGPINLLPRLKREKIRGAIVSIGDNRTRRMYASEVEAAGLELITAFHPTATMAPGVDIGRNVVVCAGAIICPGATIGDHVILNTACVIDHECSIGPAVHVCPGALLAGRVTVGAEAFIGMGAKIIQCLKIGAGATIGAGAVVIRDVMDGARMVGVPAREIGIVGST